MDVNPLPYPLPQAFVDAGDLPWLRLEPIVRRALRKLEPGDVAELRTGDRAAIAAIAGWCATSGHALIHHEPGHGYVTFWIGKREVDLPLAAVTPPADKV